MTPVVHNVCSEGSPGHLFVSLTKPTAFPQNRPHPTTPGPVRQSKLSSALSPNRQSVDTPSPLYPVSSRIVQRLIPLSCMDGACSYQRSQGSWTISSRQVFRFFLHEQDSGPRTCILRGDGCFLYQVGLYLPWKRWPALPCYVLKSWVHTPLNWRMPIDRLASGVSMRR